jgi:hypothetical protein
MSNALSFQFIFRSVDFILQIKHSEYQVIAICAWFALQIKSPEEMVSMIYSVVYSDKSTNIF